MIATPVATSTLYLSRIAKPKHQDRAHVQARRLKRILKPKNAQLVQLPKKKRRNGRRWRMRRRTEMIPKQLEYVAVSPVFKRLQTDMISGKEILDTLARVSNSQYIYI